MQITYYHYNYFVQYGYRECSRKPKCLPKFSITFRSRSRSCSLGPAAGGVPTEPAVLGGPRWAGGPVGALPARGRSADVISRNNSDFSSTLPRLELFRRATKAWLYRGFLTRLICLIVQGWLDFQQKCQSISAAFKSIFSGWQNFNHHSTSWACA